ncbi:hypothetical protein SAMN05880556_101162 [Azospirillum sp. RU38E]|nr:hypothetical protein SAMN05880556_101162 [Azospirillum sp. RU38E]SNS01657.1 hypothetical protein SAMN05880591_101162 [Azospirillum sp. RU37A]
MAGVGERAGAMGVTLIHRHHPGGRAMPAVMHDDRWHGGDRRAARAAGSQAAGWQRPAPEGTQNLPGLVTIRGDWYEARSRHENGGASTRDAPAAFFLYGLSASAGWAQTFVTRLSAVASPQNDPTECPASHGKPRSGRSGGGAGHPNRPRHEEMVRPCRLPVNPVRHMARCESIPPATWLGLQLPGNKRGGSGCSLSKASCFAQQPW